MLEFQAATFNLHFEWFSVSSSVTKLAGATKDQAEALEATAQKASTDRELTEVVSSLKERINKELSKDANMTPVEVASVVTELGETLENGIKSALKSSGATPSSLDLSNISMNSVTKSNV